MVQDGFVQYPHFEVQQSQVGYCSEKWLCERRGEEKRGEERRGKERR